MFSFRALQVKGACNAIARRSGVDVRCFCFSPASDPSFLERVEWPVAVVDRDVLWSFITVLRAVKGAVAVDRAMLRTS